MPLTEASAAVAKRARGRTLRDKRRRRRPTRALVAVVLLLLGTAVAAEAMPAMPMSGRSLDLSSFQQGTVPVSGGLIHYVRGGSGPPLVLLHGWPETWWSWHKVMPTLARTHTVIALDLPGLGSSTVPADGYDAASTARRIRQAVNGLGFHEVEILAHDLGTLVAYPYARDFPDEVTRLAVLDAPLNGFGLEEAYGLSWHFLFNATPAPIPEKIIDGQDDVKTYLGMLFNLAHHPEAIDRERYFRAYAVPVRRSAGYDYYRAFATNATDNKANASKKLTMPVLAMGAQYAFGPAVAQSFRQVANDVRQVVAPDSGHWIPEENPRFVIDCATLFFGSPPAQPLPPDLAACAP
jgi:pimeloyl-ACP methyl ester carboxylesterase